MTNIPMNLVLKTRGLPVSEEPPTWTPLSESNLWGWYKMDTNVTHVANDVSAVSDSSGNNRGLTTRNTHPTFNPTGKNGKGTVTFLNGDMGTAGSVSTGTPVTVYMVCKVITWETTKGLFSAATGGSGYIMICNSNSGHQYRLVSDLTGFNTAGAGWLGLEGSWGIITAVFNGASSSAQINNGAEEIGTVGATTLNGFTLGGRGSSPALHCNMEVAEVVVRANADNSTLKLLHKNYLAQKWAITLT